MKGNGELWCSREDFFFSMDEEIFKNNSSVWRSIGLMRKPLVEDAALVPTKDLLVIEDLNPESLPPTTDITTNINPPEKHQQLGLDASRKYIRSLTQGLEATGRSALVIIDLSMHTCEMTKAAVLESGPAQLPLYYLGFAGDDEKLDWAKQHMEGWLAEQYLAGEVKLPGSCVLPPKTLPEGVVEAAPPQPQLTTLTWCNKVKFEGLATLRTPDSLLTKYWDHSRFGAEFQAFLENARQELPLDTKAEKETGGGGKRKASGGAGPANPPLAAPAGSSQQGGSSSEAPVQQQLNAPIPVADLPSALTWEAVLVSNKNVSVVLAIGERIFLVNRSESDMTVEAGTLIAGWYKGKFWHHRNADGEAPSKKAKKGGDEGQDPCDTDLPFQLENFDSQIQCKGKMKTLGSVLLEQRKKMPDAKIAYHQIKDSPLPGKPSWFTLELKHHIYFRFESVPTKQAAAEGEAGTPKISMTHLAGCIGKDKWTTAGCDIVWAMKWSPSAEKGLQPVRPMVLTTRALKVPKQMALELTKSEGSNH